ncbi:hypothetical protein SKAU_G00199160 [Synaphobranchus kaupii]|uniref:Uncharacterized protein n=1 Tax=Synaphobranchus kaupii TaxID=118154 RepID=A0A9Q1FFF4_SYNKA|nr:hypothetical protein SKAU_G00199160 [Synaphobranchus kaupii]
MDGQMKSSGCIRHMASGGTLISEELQRGNVAPEALWRAQLEVCPDSASPVSISVIPIRAGPASEPLAN